MNLRGRLLSELLGSAFLLMMIVGSGVMAEELSQGNGALALLANSLASGAGLFVLIQALAPISGAHLNPLVSVSECWGHRLAARDCLGYVLSQIFGALLGVLLVHGMFGLEAFQIASKVRAGSNLALAEGVASFGLLAVVTLVSKANSSRVPIAVSSYILSAYWFTSSTSFANPAVTFARMFTDTFCGIAPSSVPSFLVAQGGGMVLAFWGLRPLNRSPLPVSTKTASLGSIALLSLFCFTPRAALAQPSGSRPEDPSRLPWNRDLRIAPVRSLEPLVFGESRLFLERGGVPCVIRDSKIPGRLIAVFQWFPMGEDQRSSFDQVALRLSVDDGRTWGEPVTLKISGLDSGRFQRPMDPSIIQLPDGRFRLFFTSSERGRGHFSQAGDGPVGLGMPGIYSAISTDLKTFTFEEGRRSERANTPVVDPTVVLHAGTYYLLAHPELSQRSPYDIRQGYFASSVDGYHFERRRNLGAASEGDFIGNLLSHAGRLYFFGGGPRGIWSISSKEGREWSTPGGSNLQGGDPSVFADSAGRLWMVYVGDLRADAGPAPEWLRRQRGASPIVPPAGGPTPDPPGFH